MKGHLVEARAQFVMCAAAPCPRVVTQDCEQWLGQIDAAMPTVILSAELDGRDVSDVKVLVDGVPFAEKADGLALNVDPGEHTFQFERASEFRTVTIVVREGEKRRLVAISLTAPKAPVAETHDAPAPAPPPAKDSRRTVLGFSLLGLGVVGLGASAFFGVSAVGGYDDLTRCRPDCAQSDVDAVARDRLLTAITGGVGAVGIGLGAYFLLSTPAQPAKTGLRVVPLGPGAALQGSF
jgi:hypothetical protein